MTTPTTSNLAFSRGESLDRPLDRPAPSPVRHPASAGAALGARVYRLDELDEADCLELREVFRALVHPVLTPFALDPGHPFPHLPDHSVALLVEIDAPVPVARVRRGGSLRVVRLPAALPWAHRLSTRPTEHALVLLEDLVRAHLADLLGAPVTCCVAIRVTRNAEGARVQHEAGMPSRVRAVLLAALRPHSLVPAPRWKVAWRPTPPRSRSTTV